MSIIDTRHDQMFPVLDAAQMATAQRFATEAAHDFGPGATVYDVGDRNASAWLIIKGSIELLRRDGLKHESTIITAGVGQFTGELSQLAGRGTLAAGRAGPEGCTALPFDSVHLRALIIGAAELGEIVMRAFILRRVGLIEMGGSGSVIVGRPGSPDLVRLEGFLRRNGYPYTVLDCDDEGEGRAVVERLGVLPAELPLMICPTGAVLKRPSDAEAALCLGITPDLDPAKVYDVAVVGAGPAGLATAVYAASEGLSVLILDQRAFGGQAGASARIENYLGFPTGISGLALMARAVNQAQKFGAELAIPLQVSRLDCGEPHRKRGEPLMLQLTNGSTIRSKTVVIASGAQYRRPNIANLADFEGAGISYWASPVEAKLCEGEEVALVGAGNSAGQATVYLAPRVKKLHLIVRGKGLEASMSRYLIDRIAALPNVEICVETEITALDGNANDGLTAAVFTKRVSDEVRRVPLRHLFLFIGADPNTDWAKCVAIDAKGFVRTGEGFAPDLEAPDRSPLLLETSVPGVFAVGDVRCGSTKRVAAAVGEGAAVVAQIYSVLALPVTNA